VSPTRVFVEALYTLRIDVLIDDVDSPSVEIDQDEFMRNTSPVAAVNNTGRGSTVFIVIDETLTRFVEIFTPETSSTSAVLN
jgi:hypothetical protein